MNAELSATPAASTAWRPPLLVKASVACHVGAVVAAAALPMEWRWAAGAVALNHLVLTASGLWPRSTWLGQNMLRLPPAAAARHEIAITFDDGPDPEVTPAVLDILDAHGARATFFCIAEQARSHPALCREIVRRGHSVQNHTYRHSHGFSLLGPRGFAEEIGRAQQTLAEITGQRPGFFRAPAGMRNPLLAPVLQRLDLKLVSWTRRGYDTVQRRPARVLERLTGALAAGDILLLHDGHSARTASGRPVVLEVLPALLRRYESLGLCAVTLPHAVGVEACCMRTAPNNRAAWRSLVDAASAPYRKTGRYAWHFARGKLGGDPVFRHVLRRGLIAPRARVLDIGCGQGLLASLLRAAGTASNQGRWPADWAAAPVDAHVIGIERMRRDVERGRAAIGDAATFVCADMREADFPAADAVVILDALHYISAAQQDRVLARARGALADGGSLLLRIADAGSQRGFALSLSVDRAVILLRGGGFLPLAHRPLALWVERLRGLGFEVDSEPMNGRLPFANVLLVARVVAPAQP